jgi:hypothetical protein
MISWKASLIYGMFVWIDLNKKLMDCFSSDKLCWKANILNCALHFVSLRYDVREMRINDKHTYIAMKWVRLAYFCLINFNISSTHVLWFLRSNPKLQNLIFNLIF